MSPLRSSASSSAARCTYEVVVVVAVAVVVIAVVPVVATAWSCPGISTLLGPRILLWPSTSGRWLVHRRGLVAGTRTVASRARAHCATRRQRAHLDLHHDEAVPPGLLELLDLCHGVAARTAYGWFSSSGGCRGHVDIGRDFVDVSHELHELRVDFPREVFQVCA